MSLVRGVLLAGKFRTHHELIRMSPDDQRNTLITELSARSNQSNFQAFDDVTLAGMGAVLVFLRENRIRDDAALKTMTIDDMRNTLIVELDAQTHLGAPQLQGRSNMDLVLLGLGSGERSGQGLNPPTFLPGVLLAGNFRTYRDLALMSSDDERNTLITELDARTNETGLQAHNDFELAGMGAVLVFLQKAGIRDDAALKTMTIDDMRNTLIVELDAQTHLGSRLQSLNNMDLVRVGLGVDPSLLFFTPLPPINQPAHQPYIFTIDNFEIETQKADGDHSDSDWLTYIVAIANPLTKGVRVLPPKVQRIEGSIKTGDVIRGSFETDPIDAADSDVVLVTYILTNLGSSRAEDQFAQAVKVSDKIVGVVGPIAGAAIGLIFFSDPELGAKMGQAVAKGLDTAISTLSDVFDFLNWHIAPPNCNGVVLQDTLTFAPGELAQLVNQSDAREYTGPQENSRCGAPPRTKVNFSFHRVPEPNLSVPVA